MRWWILSLALAVAAGCAQHDAAVSPSPDDLYMTQAVPLKPEVVRVPYAVPEQVPLHPALTQPTKSKDQTDNVKQTRESWKVSDTGRKAATVPPDPEGFNNGVATYVYEPGLVYQLHASPLHITTIELEAGEAVVNTMRGDETRWHLAETYTGEKEDRRAILAIKPTRPHTKTTLVIATTKRLYHVALTSYRESRMVGIAWRYPESELEQFVAREEAIHQDAATQAVATVDLAKADFEYTIEVTEGQRPDWLPTQVYNDGKRTFIRFPKVMGVDEAPVLFVQGQGDEDGTEGLIVNYRASGQHYVVDRLFRKAQLRIGGKQQTIVTIKRGA